ncbi:unnamed protein product [Penicillium pancosmium]
MDTIRDAIYLHLLDLQRLYFVDDPQNCRYWEPADTTRSTNESPNPPSDNRSDGSLDCSDLQGNDPSSRYTAADSGDNDLGDNLSPSKRQKDGPAIITSSNLGQEYSYPSVDDYDWTNEPDIQSRQKVRQASPGWVEKCQLNWGFFAPSDIGTRAYSTASAPYCV